MARRTTKRATKPKAALKPPLVFPGELIPLRVYAAWLDSKWMALDGLSTHTVDRGRVKERCRLANGDHTTYELGPLPEGWGFFQTLSAPRSSALRLAGGASLLDMPCAVAPLDRNGRVGSAPHLWRGLLGQSPAYSSYRLVYIRFSPAGVAPGGASHTQVSQRIAPLLANPGDSEAKDSNGAKRAECSMNPLTKSIQGRPHAK